MQQAVRDVGNVISWMMGTKRLLEANDPSLKAKAMQALQLPDDAAWEAKRADLLNRLNASLVNAQGVATGALQEGTPPHAQPFVASEPFGATFQSAMEEHLNDRITSTSQAVAAGVPPPYQY